MLPPLAPPSGKTSSHHARGEFLSPSAPTALPSNLLVLCVHAVFLSLWSVLTAPFRFCSWIWSVTLADAQEEMGVETQEKVGETVLPLLFGSDPLVSGPSGEPTSVTVDKPLGGLGVVLDFYRGQRVAEEAGERFCAQDVWTWGEDKLEGRHGFIQTLFPTTRPSNFVSTAPVLNVLEVNGYFAQHSDVLREMQDNLRQSLHTMLRFYGLEMNGETKEIRRGGNFASRSRNWLTAGNHNHLRLTRILCCLKLFKMDKERGALLAVLGDIYAHEGRTVISAKTFGFWQSAAGFSS